ncbi:uncharacterized protein LOC126162037 [Schistocerca cancellata]|uniref:uncharacterized protein LOC126162037 n=1 Tax=Schistocerca cancellata TaxID=274614 RepID=UPI002118777D|nr:uncharacterized protein LOC126162037 [Schistocerca cancellata]XP_049774235.1 uncharacterized protein LOC126162037 [Schistocerca cancellata]XP_049774244.1 uncharacterized protein LOC126162037 [Schistocerca cancellata]
MLSRKIYRFTDLKDEWPRQPPEGVITTLRDDPMETEPLPPPPPFIQPMELDSPTLQQPMTSTSGYGLQEVDAYPSGHFPGDVSIRVNAGWWDTTGSLTSSAATAPSPV